jgi:hypothetical protein
LIVFAAKISASISSKRIKALLARMLLI